MRAADLPSSGLLVEGPFSVDVYDIVGIYDDHWCAPELRFSIQPEAETSACHLVLWLKAEPSKAHSHLTIAFDSAAAFAFEAPHDAKILVSVRCDLPARTTATIGISCDNLVTETGHDRRDLSFKLLSVGFS